MSPLPSTTSLPSWPPADGLTTINCPRSEAAFSVRASTYIAAPASTVWSTLRNTTAFPEWNTFTPSALITSQPLRADLPPEEQAFLNLGTRFTYNVVLDPANLGPDGEPVGTPSMENVTDFSTPGNPSTYVPRDVLVDDGSFYPDLEMLYRIAWITDGEIVGQGLYSERFNEIIELGEGCGVQYRTWELQCGPLAEFVRDAYGALLQERFEDWARDLKGESEVMVGSGYGRGLGKGHGRRWLCGEPESKGKGEGRKEARGRVKGKGKDKGKVQDDGNDEE